jgi:hypothetical protein
VETTMNPLSCDGVTWTAPKMSDSVHPFLITIGVMLTLVFVADAIIAYLSIKDAKND